MRSPAIARSFALLAVLAMPPARCAGHDPRADSGDERPMASEQQPASRSWRAVTSGFAEPAELVVRDSAALAALWSTLNGGRLGNPPPEVDFSRHSVVVLALGPRRTAGFSVRFDDVEREENGAVVRYTVTRPGPGCMTAQMITSPVEVVRVPRLPADVRFERREATDPC
jgi:hypothetical protein